MADSHDGEPGPAGGSEAGEPDRPSGRWAIEAAGKAEVHLQACRDLRDATVTDDAHLFIFDSSIIGPDSLIAAEARGRGACRPGGTGPHPDRLWSTDN